MLLFAAADFCVIGLAWFVLGVFLGGFFLFIFLFIFLCLREVYEVYDLLATDTRCCGVFSVISRQWELMLSRECELCSMMWEQRLCSWLSTCFSKGSTDRMFAAAISKQRHTEQGLEATGFQFCNACFLQKLWRGLLHLCVCALLLACLRFLCSWPAPRVCRSRWFLLAVLFYNLSLEEELQRNIFWLLYRWIGI